MADCFASQAYLAIRALLSKGRGSQRLRLFSLEGEDFELRNIQARTGLRRRTGGR